MASTNDFSDGPAGDSIDNDYVSRTGQAAIKVQKDEAPVESGVNPDTEDSDEQLGMSPIIHQSHKYRAVTEFA
jgi:hypothetical protein